MSTTARQSFKARVSGPASEVMNKSNGGAYVLHNCVITEEGPLKGLVVTGTRTIKNAEGVEKEGVNTNDEVQLFLTQVPSTQDPSKMQNFFEISTGLTASQDEINAKLALLTSPAVDAAIQGGTF